jgi:hypothetical protein
MIMQRMPAWNHLLFPSQMLTLMEMLSEESSLAEVLDVVEADRERIIATKC